MKGEKKPFLTLLLFTMFCSNTGTICGPCSYKSEMYVGVFTRFKINSLSDREPVWRVMWLYFYMQLNSTCIVSVGIKIVSRIAEPDNWASSYSNDGKKQKTPTEPWAGVGLGLLGWHAQVEPETPTRMVLTRTPTAAFCVEAVARLVLSSHILHLYVHKLIHSTYRLKYHFFWSFLVE